LLRMEQLTVCAGTHLICEHICLCSQLHSTNSM
jgi:hypothetical protein